LHALFLIRKINMSLCFILAAGKGKRFSLSEYFPKQLVYLPKYGYLILNLIRNIEHLCDEIKVTISNKSTLLGEILDRNMLVYFHEPELNIERKIDNCRDYIRKREYKGDVIIINGDLFLSEKLENYQEVPSFLVVRTEKILDTSKREDIVILENGYIKSLIFDQRGGYPYMLGRIAAINSDLLLRTKSRSMDSLLEEILEMGIPVRAWFYNGYYANIDRFEDYINLVKWILRAY